MAINEIRVGDVGTKIEGVIKNSATGLAEDISGATEKKLIFKKPNGNRVIKVATFTNTGTDGKIKYTTEAGFLDMPGNWEYQGFVTLASWEGKTDIASFEVFGNI